MSQNLTQPEEVERVLKAMTSCDLSVDKPHPDGYQSSATIQNVKCNGVAVVTDFPCGTEHGKPTHGFCESHPYVWSM